MKKFLCVCLSTVLVLMAASCADEEKPHNNSGNNNSGNNNSGNNNSGNNNSGNNNSGNNNSGNQTDCEENAFSQCYNNTTAKQCIGGVWTNVPCNAGQICSSDTHQCVNAHTDPGGETNDTNHYGPKKWWETIDISNVNDLNEQSNITGASCNPQTFHESCNNNDGKILYCDKNIVTQFDCKEEGYAGCAYYPALNFADCVYAEDRCDTLGASISGCTSDDEYFDYFYNAYCALSDQGELYWAYELSYCSDICTEDKGCAVTPCTSKYKDKCDGEYGYVCYEGHIAMLNCHQLNAQCTFDNGPECAMSEHK